jgi:Uma2 family endonuclease
LLETHSKGIISTEVPMATSPALLSIEQYLHTSYKPDVHFVDGEIEERNVGESPHSRIQGFITHLFLSHETEWSAEPLVEQRIRIGSSRVRVCDIAVVHADAPFEEVIVTAPLLCIEILSPEDRLSRAELVLADYFAMGVPNIWLIDPIRRVAYTFGAKGLQLADVTHLTIPGTPILLDLTQAFAKLDKKLGINESTRQ